MAGTIQPGVCRHIMRCASVLEAAFQGIPYQVCASPENRLIVCCPWVPGQGTGLQARCQANTTIPREGDNCTMVDTGRAGVCNQFANCQTAIEAASKGQSPQICAVEGTTQIVCCPLVTVAEGDQCSTATGRTGKCLRISKCPVAVEAALMGKTPQICVLDGSFPVVCCEGVIEGDSCTVVNTGKTGVCRPFANCQTAKEAAYRGILPQICNVKGTKQNVCCPLETIVEGSNCTLKHTGKVGVCRPFANCHSAQEAASKGITPQRCDLTDNESELVCCTKTDRPPLPKGLLTQLPIASKAADWSNCTLKHTGKVGVCRPFANCHPAQEGASKGILPQRCDLIDNESELVCCTKTDCPPLQKGLVTQLPVGSKAADLNTAQESQLLPSGASETMASPNWDCIELAEKIYPCQETRSGWTRGDTCPLLTPDSNKVVYHRTPMTTTAEAPYYGHIGSGRRGAIQWWEYSVSLVSDQWVLCPATAIGNIVPSVINFVGLGGTFSPHYNPDEIYGVTKLYTHPLYVRDYSYVYNSITLLQLDRRVKFTARIQPACLHTGTPLPDSGFIQTGWDGSSTSPRYKSTMRIPSQKECSKVGPNDSSYHPAGVKHDLEICSRPVITTGGCTGWYEGATLTLYNSSSVVCTHLLVGLKSYLDTSFCTYTNTRIFSFIPWIEGIVWPEK